MVSRGGVRVVASCAAHLDVQREPVEHQPLGPQRVTEADALHLEVARARGRRERLRGRWEQRLTLDPLEHLVRGADGLRERGVDVADGSEGGEDALQVEDEGLGLGLGVGLGLGLGT